VKFGVGARVSAMGEAGVTLTNDVSGLYWNPSGIARIGKPSLMVSRNALYTNLAYSFLGFVYPFTAKNVVGISAIFFNFR